MSKFNFIQTSINGVVVVEPTVFGDSRGFFMETYNLQEFGDLGLDLNFVQDNHSKSRKGVLRGLHFQRRYPQGKLVRVIRGEVFDVAVDLRKDSSTYKKWYGVILSEDNKKQLYIPKGFAHGFLVLTEEAEFVYKCTEFYRPEDEDGIAWNDEEIGIDWPMNGINDLLLSDKDKKWKSLKDTEVSHMGKK